MPASQEMPMSGVTEPLVLDLVEWVGRKPRAYAEVMEAWHTSCPRLPVWEEAVERGLVARRAIDGQGTCVVLTPAGAAFLAANGRASVPSDCAGSGAFSPG
jgi:hypothetical protein